ncbi:GLEYA domain-containing protein [Streptomyces sp. R28]|uniref:GLEYA domain-containing protein n=1 Tax=Streptomyces sp. R28 TaxID=3238628 RepID=A0AB39PX87_9ACTN
MNHTRTAVATILAAAAFLGTAALAPVAVADDGREQATTWHGDNKPHTAYKKINAGKYYPIRVLWGNTNGAGYLHLDIYGPSGR